MVLMARLWVILEHVLVLVVLVRGRLDGYETFGDGVCFVLCRWLGTVRGLMIGVEGREREHVRPMRHCKDFVDVVCDDEDVEPVKVSKEMGRLQGRGALRAVVDAVMQVTLSPTVTAMATAMGEGEKTAEERKYYEHFGHLASRAPCLVNCAIVCVWTVVLILLVICRVRDRWRGMLDSRRIFLRVVRVWLDGRMLRRSGRAVVCGRIERRRWRGRNG
ncbi:hypothetical protein P280DRAFT_169332 [Massarina eburnea CBS 473.64]|uniref:Uncharacterized protein n=1 Tax=Massarina eburnea CBS 473.64 TaxID=1395130 RepID=A0A6A6RNF5_9PLEO|nr:hypothetical protein P280DRAFT_169332 [Massarina eburnea CBS 473.64]